MEISHCCHRYIYHSISTIVLVVFCCCFFFWSEISISRNGRNIPGFRSVNSQVGPLHSKPHFFSFDFHCDTFVISRFVVVTLSFCLSLYLSEIDWMGFSTRFFGTQFFPKRNTFVERLICLIYHFVSCWFKNNDNTIHFMEI